MCGVGKDPSPHSGPSQQRSTPPFPQARGSPEEGGAGCGGGGRGRGLLPAPPSETGTPHPSAPSPALPGHRLPWGQKNCGAVRPHLPWGQKNCGAVRPHQPWGQKNCGAVRPHQPGPNCQSDHRPDLGQNNIIFYGFKYFSVLD